MLAEYQARYEKELFESVIPFWMKHSLDRANEVKRQVAQQRKEEGAR